MELFKLLQHRWSIRKGETEDPSQPLPSSLLLYSVRPQRLPSKTSPVTNSSPSLELGLLLPGNAGVYCWQALLQTFFKRLFLFLPAELF